MKFTLWVCIIVMLSCRERPPASPQQVEPPIKPIRTTVHTDTLERYDPVGDSIQLKKLLDTLRLQAYRQRNHRHFSLNSDTVTRGSFSWFGFAKFGLLFSKRHKHLLVLRISRNLSMMEAYADIFLYNGGQFRKVVSDTSGDGFYKHRMEDVNGDGFDDFIMESYSGTGCCPRTVIRVCLFKSGNGGFVRADFFNPDFFPQQKLVYETGYGSIGAVEIDKYRWEGLRKIRVEHIEPVGMPAPETLPNKKFIIIRYPGGRQLVTAKVPAEYKKLELYNHFLGDMKAIQRELQESVNNWNKKHQQ